VTSELLKLEATEQTARVRSSSEKGGPEVFWSI